MDIIYLVMESASIQTCKFKHMTKRRRPQAFLSLRQSNADNFISLVLSVCTRNPHETGNKIQQGAGPHSTAEQLGERNRARQVLPNRLLIILHTETIPFKNANGTFLMLFDLECVLSNKAAEMQGLILLYLFVF